MVAKNFGENMTGIDTGVAVNVVPGVWVQYKIVDPIALLARLRERFIVHHVPFNTADPSVATRAELIAHVVSKIPVLAGEEFTFRFNGKIVNTVEFGSQYFSQLTQLSIIAMSHMEPPPCLFKPY